MPEALPQGSQLPLATFWKFFTSVAISLVLFLQITPAAIDRVHLTPNVVKRKRRKEKTPPSLIRFGKSSVCQIHYLMPAQADTCARPGAG
jgi:hypothetical protein